jgi:hypothetical protein
MMISSEIFSKCLPHTASLTPGVGGIPDLTWEDVLQSLQGIEKKHEGFIRYVHLDDSKGRHDFFAGLMMELCSRPDIQRWCKFNPGRIESLVLFAIKEWKHSRAKYTDESRAYAFGVRVHTWRRHFKQIYSVIVAIPAYWEDEVMQLVRKRLGSL